MHGLVPFYKLCSMRLQCPESGHWIGVVQISLPAGRHVLVSEQHLCL